jgi:uncharacterized protein YdaU (DUF1376 family)
VTTAPAYQWYPRDHLADPRVRMMTVEQEGAYRILLDYQWANGFIPVDLKQLATICKNMPIPRMRQIWPALAPCFVPAEGDPARLYNRRLERVRVAARAYKDHQSKAGKRGAEAKWHRQGEGHGREEASTMRPQSNANKDATAERSQCPEDDQDDGTAMFGPMSGPMAKQRPEHGSAVCSLQTASVPLPSPRSLTPRDLSKSGQTTPAGKHNHHSHSNGQSNHGQPVCRWPELLGCLRELCAPAGGEVSEADMDTNGNIASRLTRLYTLQELAQAAEGRRARIDAGRVPATPPGSGWSLRVWWDKEPVRNQIDLDLAYGCVPPATPAATGPPAAARRALPSNIADVLKGLNTQEVGT